MKVVGLNLECHDEDFHSDPEGQKLVADINGQLPKQVCFVLCSALWLHKCRTKSWGNAATYYCPYCKSVEHDTHALIVTDVLQKPASRCVLTPLTNPSAYPILLCLESGKVRLWCKASH